LSTFTCKNACFFKTDANILLDLSSSPNRHQNLP
jgi:hypothetical protein